MWGCGYGAEDKVFHRGNYGYEIESYRVGFPNVELDENEGITEQLTKKGLSLVLGNILHVWVPRFLWYHRARREGEAPR